MRSHYCGHLNKSLVGQTVELCGWVNRRRDLGGLIFIDMRDREGIVQVVVDPDMADVFAVANQLRSEFCIKLTGEVRARPESQVNKEMATGEVERWHVALRSLTVQMFCRSISTKRTQKSNASSTVIWICVAQR